MVVKNINIAKKCSFPVDGSEENKLKTIVVALFSCDFRIIQSFYDDKMVKARNLLESEGISRIF